MLFRRIKVDPKLVAKKRENRVLPPAANTNLKPCFSPNGVLQSYVCYQDPRPLLFPQLPTISINLDSFWHKEITNNLFPTKIIGQTSSSFIIFKNVSFLALFFKKGGLKGFWVFQVKIPSSTRNCSSKHFISEKG